jgi:hypothetical protein
MERVSKESKKPSVVEKPGNGDDLVTFSDMIAAPDHDDFEEVQEIAKALGYRVGMTRNVKLPT